MAKSLPRTKDPTINIAIVIKEEIYSLDTKLIKGEMATDIPATPPDKILFGIMNKPADDAKQNVPSIVNRIFFIIRIHQSS